MQVFSESFKAQAVQKAIVKQKTLSLEALAKGLNIGYSPYNVG